MTTATRQSIRLGQPLLDLLDSGHCQHTSIARRLDTLAARYSTVLAGTTAPAWPIASWQAFIRLAKTLDLSHPGAVWSILGAVKATPATKALAYALDSAPVAQQILLISIAERAPDPADPAALATFLEGIGITPSA